MAKKTIRVMNTSFRDGFQSVYGARVLTKDFLPAVKAACDAGVDYFESGGGARFQSLFFYCNENAFDMMDSFRETVGPSVELQTLARGINVVGLESQSSDIINLHAKLFKKHGVTSIRNFDALNDVNNLIYSGKCIVDAGLKHQVVVTMMELPPGCTGSHTAEYYAQVLKDILAAEIKFDSVCFKDASGTSTPTKVYNSIKLAREILPSNVPLIFHSHDTAGTGTTTYKAAVEAGADGLDLAMAPVSGGTGQPDILTFWHVLRGTDYQLNIDVDKIVEAERVFKECMQDYFMPPEACMVDPMIIFSPMPGGALTANTQMMRDNNLMDKYPEVIKAMSEVVKLGGFGTSVTPVSQFYFQQAFNNVIFGPWKKIADGYGKMVLGYFGKTPVEPDKKIVDIASEQLNLPPTKKSPLEINDADPEKGIKAAKAKLEEAKLPLTEENIFIAATCGFKGIDYLNGEAKVNVRKISKEQKPSGYTITLNNKKYDVELDSTKAIVNGKTYTYSVSNLEQTQMNQKTDKPEVTPSEASVSISSPLPGTIIKIEVSVGDTVNENDTILTLEAMKMETAIKASSAGTITSINTSQGAQVSTGQVLATIN